ncbi:MAG TPA: tRNA (adenosine(37)-N6)-threonylcarbamoyltransferase complex dimerization subunit type 1 TsaB [Bacteroidota bacterium]|nr:tRNA (adenosine(37)-N6)-threonylcarbamoyltransferase complex dimerization subunit type 1 TsaB [Bacteroidota bacterium]
MILSIETATELCGAALIDDGFVVAHRTVTEKNIHSERLMVLVDEVLREAGVAVKDLAGIAVSIGPGSFTGLRIGLSTAKGLAYAQSLPMIPVPTLDAIAEEAVRTGVAASGDVICALIDAKRDEAYYAFFVCDNANTPDGSVENASVNRHGEIRRLSMYSIASVKAIAEEAGRYSEDRRMSLPAPDAPLRSLEAPLHASDVLLSASDAPHHTPDSSSAAFANDKGHAPRIIVVGDAAAKIAPFVQQLPRTVCDEQIACSPIAIGSIAERRFAELSMLDFDELEPAYIRDFVTTTPRVANQTTIP